MDLRIRRIYDLKKVYRMNSVENRKESSAEHSWSALILADYFLCKMKGLNVNRLKVYELLMYHDLVEIIVGDVGIDDEEGRRDKVEKEMRAMGQLKEELPVELAEKYVALFTEYEDCETIEAKFAKAIDGLDAQIHELDYKKDWKGWDEAKFRKYVGPKVRDFPLLVDFFEELVVFVTKNGYFQS